MAGRAGNIAPESRTQGVILSETARRPRYGGRTHFCGKTDRRNPLRNDTASSSRRHAGRDSADTKAVIRTERQRKEARRGDGVRATANKRRAMNDGRRNGRRTTGGEGMDGDGRRWTAGGRSKEWRKKNQTEYRRRRTDRQSWRAAGRESYRRRELRAERATGGESYGPARRKRKTGRKTEQRAMQRRQTGLQSQAAKKQACATAGPTTRPEGRHTIFISARPEYASQRRESSYRPA